MSEEMTGVFAYGISLLFTVQHCGVDSGAPRVWYYFLLGKITADILR